MRLSRRGRIVAQRVYAVPNDGGEDERWRETARTIGADLKAGRLKMRPLPRVAVELGRLASSADPDVRRAEEVIQRDSQLAARVLKTAGSLAFGARPPTSIREASVRLGVAGLRDMAFAASMAGVFRCPGLDDMVREEMAHGFVTAVLTGVVCRMMKLDAQAGFVAGLLHDVGRLVVMTALSEYGRKDNSLLDRAFVRRVGERAHSKLGGYLLEDWGVDAAVQKVARFHHRPERSDEPLVTVVAMADHIDRVGGDTEEERVERLLAQPCGAGPELSTAHVEALATAAQQARQDPALADLAA
ncbi:MAG: HDOD domain-containing protein [Nannocystaceae bacterium]|nr:HDOD domain-containing protein [Nannocystaceae bacterium]